METSGDARAGRCLGVSNQYQAIYVRWVAGGDAQEDQNGKDMDGTPLTTGEYLALLAPGVVNGAGRQCRCIRIEGDIEYRDILQREINLYMDKLRGPVGWHRLGKGQRWKV